MKIHNYEQYSPQWWANRIGKPTGSKAKSLVTSKGEPSKSMNAYAVELAYTLYAGEELDKWEGNASTERGSELEDDARQVYQFTHDVEATEVGFITDDLESYGVSPDSLIGSNGGLEIKCQEAKGHTNTLLYFNKHKRAPTDHIAQVQMSLLVTGYEWWDLMHYHPKLPPLVIRMYPDEAIFKQLQMQIPAVIKERDRIVKILHES